MIGMLSQGLARIRKRREAAAWHVAHEAADECVTRPFSEFGRWSKGRRNRSEYAQMIRLRQLMRAQSAPSAPTDAELFHDVTDTPELHSDSTALGSDDPSRTTRLRLKQSRAGSIIGALTAVAAAAATVFLLRAYPLAVTGTIETYSTRVGERLEVHLRDGSLVVLEASSTLVARFADKRDIYLEQGGSTFKVVHDTAHPFIVHTGGGTITALGTEFTVHRYSKYSNRVRVWVSDGAVEVLPPTPARTAKPFSTSEHPTPTRVVRGEEVAYDATGARQAVDSVTVPNRVAGMFVYRACPLADVIEDLQRYSMMRIAVDPSVGEIKFSGSVSQRDVAQWLLELPDIFPSLRVEAHGDAILIGPRFSDRSHGPQSAQR